MRNMQNYNVKHTYIVNFCEDKNWPDPGWIPVSFRRVGLDIIRCLTFWYCFEPILAFNMFKYSAISMISLTLYPTFVKKIQCRYYQVINTLAIIIHRTAKGCHINLARRCVDSLYRLDTVFSYKLQWNVGFGLVEMIQCCHSVEPASATLAQRCENTRLSRPIQSLRFMVTCTREYGTWSWNIMSKTTENLSDVRVNICMIIIYLFFCPLVII